MKDRSEVLRAVQLRQRETRRKMLDLQVAAIVGLREVLEAVSETQHEIESCEPD